MVTNRDKAPFLYIFVNIPIGVKVELQSRDISVTSALVTGTKRFPIPAFRDPRYSVAPGKPPRPSTGGELNFQELSATTSFFICLPMPKIPVGDLRVELPDMRIRERLAKIPPIEFKKFPRVVVIAPLNC